MQLNNQNSQNDQVMEILEDFSQIAILQPQELDKEISAIAGLAVSLGMDSVSNFTQALEEA